VPGCDSRMASAARSPWHDLALKLLFEHVILVDLTFYRSFTTSSHPHAAAHTTPQGTAAAAPHLPAVTLIFLALTLNWDGTAATSPSRFRECGRSANPATWKHSPAPEHTGRNHSEPRPAPADTDVPEAKECPQEPHR
jgi:hypothetical protein